MGFLDKAKAAANDLAAKADTAMANAGLGGPGGPGGASPERYFRDLGVIAYLEATGRTAPPEEKQRITAALTEMEQRGGIASFALQTAAPPPGSVPPPPGAAAAPPPGATAPPPPAPPPAPVGEPGAESPTTPASAPPPPPPSWAGGDASS
jgi:hypothetical protein